MRAVIASEPETEPPAQRIGDRLEQALDHRADVEGEIERGERREPARAALVKRLIQLAICGVSLYLVAPSVIDLLGSWRDLDELAPKWLLAMLLLQAATTVCYWALQRVALHTRDWFAVATSQLASNAITKVVPGGGAVGAALQYKMLTQAGIVRARAVAGLTAASLLTLAIVLALPVLALPALVRGDVNRTLVEATVAGLVLFAVLFGIGALMLAADRPLAWTARTIQRVRNRLRRHSEPLTGLPKRLLRERDTILGTVGKRWKAALAAGIGRWLFDYATLLAALTAVGATPRPALVLLAFCAAQLLAQIPATPGGLGFVEAGLTATLALCGVPAGQAVLATFAYRLFTYWLPLPLGLVGVLLFRRRYPAVSPA
jgi:uncharacterized protein (TIRG00374 family)